MSSTLRNSGIPVHFIWRGRGREREEEGRGGEGRRGGEREEGEREKRGTRSQAKLLYNTVALSVCPMEPAMLPPISVSVEMNRTEEKVSPKRVALPSLTIENRLINRLAFLRMIR